MVPLAKQLASEELIRRIRCYETTVEYSLSLQLCVCVSYLSFMQLRPIPGTRPFLTLPLCHDDMLKP